MERWFVPEVADCLEESALVDGSTEVLVVLLIFCEGWRTCVYSVPVRSAVSLSRSPALEDGRGVWNICGPLSGASGVFEL